VLCAIKICQLLTLPSFRIGYGFEFGEASKQKVGYGSGSEIKRCRSATLEMKTIHTQVPQGIVRILSSTVVNRYLGTYTVLTL
jgi:hypothetical protein